MTYIHRSIHTYSKIIKNGKTKNGKIFQISGLLIEHFLSSRNQSVVFKQYFIGIWNKSDPPFGKRTVRSRLRQNSVILDDIVNREYGLERLILENRIPGKISRSCSNKMGCWTSLAEFYKIEKIRILLCL